MRAVMVMFDSLNRRFIESYGCDFNRTPNFCRLAEKTAQFDNFYAGSLPCMPARRDIHTGRYSFLHRSWGALEPFDNSMPEILSRNGIYTRLISDHYHYWEDGGSTYHSRYSSWENIRGQECDRWSDMSGSPKIPAHVPTMREYTHPVWWQDNWKNREHYRRRQEWPTNCTFDEGLDFLARNVSCDDWFLQIETFAPHEPFDSPDELKNYNGDSYDGPVFDWPPYAPVTETSAEIEHMRKRYEAVLSMCDANLGRVIDFMDQHDMWKDTMLIVNTDHGFMLGEKDWWAKSVMPCYNEIANIPFFLWDPRIRVKGVKRRALCQTIDIAPTLLEYFEVPIPVEMMGKPLASVMKDDQPIRDAAIFGFHGSFANVTDGRYVYMRASSSVGNQPLYEYTCIAVHQQGMFTPEELSRAELCSSLPFAKDAKVMKIPVLSRLANATFCNSFQYGNLLFDLKTDPEQLNPIDNPAIEAECINCLIAKMKEADAPAEQYERLGLDPLAVYDSNRVLAERQTRISFADYPVTAEFIWTEETKRIFIGMLALVGEQRISQYLADFQRIARENTDRKVTLETFQKLAGIYYSKDEHQVFYFLNKLKRIR